MYGDGAADEVDLVSSLQKLLIWHRAGLAGTKGFTPVDIVSLSLGYYHETPGAVDDEAALFLAIRELQRAGVSVVAAAGNGSTTEEFWPAALATPDRTVEDAAPLTSVGARNATGGSVALFSNTGRWVRAYRCGVAVVSTMPVTLNGSLGASVTVQAPPRTPRHGRHQTPTTSPAASPCGTGRPSPHRRSPVSWPVCSRRADADGRRRHGELATETVPTLLPKEGGS